MLFHRLDGLGRLGRLGLSRRRGRRGFNHLLLPRHRDFVKLAFLLFREFEEIGNVKERVAFQANIHEGRLHARKYPGDAAFVNGSCQGVFVLAFEIDFRELIVLNQPDFGFMGRGGHK